MDTNTKNGSWRIFSGDLLIAAVMCMLAIFLFYFLASVVVIGERDLFDTAAFRWIDSYHTPFNTRMALIITFLGGGSFLFPAYIAIVLYLFWKKKKKYALMMAAVATVSFLLGALLKNLFQRERPSLVHLDVVSGYSFPSGHSLAAFTFSGMMIAVVWLGRLPKTQKVIYTVLLFLLACIIALSRVYLHVHYASDVIAGFCVTVIWLGICFIYFSWDNKKWFV